MAKWKFAVLVFLGTSAEAHELQLQADGCAVLEQVIYDEVTAASWGVTGTDTSLANFEEPSVVVCSRTTRTATRAFATAMQMVGQDVTWNLPIGPGMEACLGGDIEQCITTPSPWLPVTRLDDTWLVSSTWTAVSRALQLAMPEGTASDRSIFNRDSLRRAVRSAVRNRQTDAWSGRSRRANRID